MVPPLRYLIDSRLFRRLCVPGDPAALAGFRESAERHGLAPAGGLPPLEMTPFGFLDAIGIPPPPYEVFRLPPKVSHITKENVTLTTLLAQRARDFYAQTPELKTENLREHAAKLRDTLDPAAHELFDLCVTRFAARENLGEILHGHLAFDFLYRFRFPENLREDIFDFLAASLFAAGETVSGLSKVRIVKALWDRYYERLLKRNPGARADVQALDREINPKTFQDFLDWEVLHHAILGYGDEHKRVRPVTAFTPETEATAKARCSAYKSALRVFLDQVNREELATSLKPALDAWKPGAVVPCREDGTFDSVIQVGDLPVF